MTSHTSACGEERLRNPEDFSLVLGGPLFQSLRRSHLSGDTLALSMMLLEELLKRPIGLVF
jgi:hypothetical protein